VPFSRNIIEAKKKLKTTSVIVDSRLINRKEVIRHNTTNCKSEKENNHLTMDFTDNALSPSPFQYYFESNSKSGCAVLRFAQHLSHKKIAR
jgi:hypothetical protein